MRGRRRGGALSTEKLKRRRGAPSWKPRGAETAAENKNTNYFLGSWSLWSKMRSNAKESDETQSRVWLPDLMYLCDGG